MNSFRFAVTQIAPLAIIAAVLFGYQYLSADWSEPSAPGATDLAATNVPAPLNTGSDAQVKSGALSVDAMTVFGNVQVNDPAAPSGDVTINGDRVVSGTAYGASDLLVDGAAAIQSTSPTLEFRDEDNADWWAHVNTDRFYLLPDRDGDGIWSGNWPLEIYAHPSDSNSDIAVFSNQVRANSYCDRGGGNCITPGASLGGNVQMVEGIYGHDNNIWPAAGFTAAQCVTSQSLRFHDWPGQNRFAGVSVYLDNHGSYFHGECLIKDSVTWYPATCNYTMICAR